MRDPELREEQAATQEMVIAAMAEVDPEAEKLLERREELQSELSPSPGG